MDAPPHYHPNHWIIYSDMTPEDILELIKEGIRHIGLEYFNEERYRYRCNFEGTVLTFNLFRLNHNRLYVIEIYDFGETTRYDLTKIFLPFQSYLSHSGLLNYKEDK